jgi:hypothetical protein
VDSEGLRLTGSATEGMVPSAVGYTTLSSSMPAGTTNCSYEYKQMMGTGVEYSVACTPVARQRPRKNSYTAAVAEKWLPKQVCLHGDNWKQQRRRGVFCEVRTEIV